jgi:serine/threonine protein kinase
MSDSLVQYFRKKPVLETDIGDFEYVSSMGQGGNAHVLKFKRAAHEFAVKFIPHGENGKLARFRDEFFGAAQIPTHTNIARSYHFDTKVLNGTTYSLIIMKAYGNTLNKVAEDGPQHKHPDRKELAWKLFINLCSGLNHLHTNHIIHRDIKPQNIFYDEKADAYVIGDLGIAHFNAEVFAKEAKTKPSDRMANYLFSAPEQADSRNTITEAADIYSLGQVMQWLMTGATVRGLGRTTFADTSPQDEMSILDAFAAKALRDRPTERFQSIKEISEFVKAAKQPPEPDPWVKLDAFDLVIRQSFPQINKTLSVTDSKEIEGFLTKFQADCNPEDFWYMHADEGDGHFQRLEYLGGKNWLFNNSLEMTVNRLLVHRDNGYAYKNFFILLFGPDKRFTYSNWEGKRIKRASTDGWNQDAGTLVDGKFYINPAETKNGFYKMGNETVPVNGERFSDRERYLKPFGLMVVPTQTASAIMNDRGPTGELIRAAVQNKELTEQDLRIYLNATRGHHSYEITKWN